MRYSIGYQLPDENDSTPEICADYRSAISDVYFSFGREPSGRSPLLGNDPGEQERLEEYQLGELRQIRDMGISLTLLLNANCYGGRAASSALREHVLALCHTLSEKLGLSNVTTASPFLAACIKKEFGDALRVRASVNMRVDTVQAMEQLSSCFDGFYLRKELNRDLSAIAELHSWCGEHGKTLHLLANSGCLSYCAFQTFHDNAVAHESELLPGEGSSAPGLCRDYLRSLPRQEALAVVLGAGWVRPEEIRLYEPYFSEVKLATRMHARPRMVVAAYARGRFTGSLLDLTEPSYSSLFRGTVLDNTRMPPDWAEHATHCNHRCRECGFCRRTADRIALSVDRI